MTYTATASGSWQQEICHFIHGQFPQPDAITGEDLVDLIEAEFFATKQLRNGTIPGPESRVKVRETIRKYTSANKPIPIVVPWGSAKPDGSSIDVAELMAVRALKNLDQRISEHYTPGTAINIRIEDASAPYLFNWKFDQAWSEAARYTDDMNSLLRVLGAHAIELRPESHFLTPAAFAEFAALKFDAFLRAITTGEHEQLRAWGWKSEIKGEFLDYCLNKYKRRYPWMTLDERYEMLARYFASVMLRNERGLHGDDPQWNGDYLGVSFGSPIPGTAGFFGKRAYYRTMPRCYTSNHLPPWRAKGYFVANEDSTVCPKMTTFDDPRVLEFSKETVTLTATRHSVTIQAGVQDG